MPHRKNSEKNNGLDNFEVKQQKGGGGTSNDTWDEDDVKSEILDYYGEETLMDLMPEQPQQTTEIGALEATANDYGVGK